MTLISYSLIIGISSPYGKSTDNSGHSRNAV